MNLKMRTGNCFLLPDITIPPRQLVNTQERRGVIEALPNPIEAIAYLAAFRMLERVSALL